MLRFNWTADSHAQSGLTSGDVAAALRPVFRARTPVGYVDMAGDPQLDVRIEVEGADRLDVERLAEQPLLVSDSAVVQLATLAEYRVEDRPTAIMRNNQRYERTIQVDFRGPARMATEFIEAALEGYALPVGYELERARFAFFDEEVERQFVWLIWATIGLVFLIAAAVFESWRLPLIVMISVPSALVGVTTGFLWTDANFAEGAFIGAILMVGIAVNDSILLVDRYRQLRELRPATSSSILMRLAVRERLRPMVTTTLTSVAAMVPMVVFPEDSDFWLGLAVTVVGGLTASTILSPVISVAMAARRGRN